MKFSLSLDCISCDDRMCVHLRQFPRFMVDRLFLGQCSWSDVCHFLINLYVGPPSHNLPLALRSAFDCSRHWSFSECGYRSCEKLHSLASVRTIAVPWQLQELLNTKPRPGWKSSAGKSASFSSPFTLPNSISYPFFRLQRKRSW